MEYNPPDSSVHSDSPGKNTGGGCHVLLQGVFPTQGLNPCLLLKLQDFGHLMGRVDSLEKTHAGRDWGQEEKGMTEDEMAGWHHGLDGRESE